MDKVKVFLKPNVMIEPLYNQWYAWSGLIAPATSAMFIANWHLKVMQSFIAAPQVHVAALKNQGMLGGPFINYGIERAADVRALAEKTRREQAHMLELAEAIRTFDHTLQSEADGASLEPLYAKVPEALRGYIELVYDLNHHPSMRFIEGLLYRSRYANESAQSLTLSLISDDERPFAFSTPRLDDETRLRLRMPFKDEALDLLFKSKESAAPFGQLCEALGVGASDAELFSSFFTEEEPPTRAARYAGDAPRVRYFGHACLLIETKETSILCDPVISYHYGGATERYSFADLPEQIDYVVITHNHQDHCMFETLLQLRHKVRNVLVPKNNGGGLADPSLKLVLENIGFRNVREIDEMESVEVAGGAITGLPFLGEHTDLNVRTKMAYLITLAGKSIMCAADSNNIEPKLYEHIHEAVGDVDVVFIGMECDGAPMSWLYGPLLTKPLSRKLDQSRRLNGSDYERGIKIIERLNPKQVYVYAMGQEPWLTYLTSIKYTDESAPIVESNRLVADCAGRGLVAERLFGCREIFTTCATSSTSAGR